LTHVNRSEHVIDLPKRIIVGYGVLEKVGYYLAKTISNKGNVLVVTGPKVKALYYSTLRDSLEEEGFSVSYRIVREPTLEISEDVANEVVKEKIDIVIGFGGGKSIDIAKYASKLSDAYFVSIPTVASHDGITSPFASLRGFNRPISKPAKTPSLILMDVDVIASAPRRYNIAGFGDIIGKYTSVLDWRLAHKLKGEYYGGYAASLALMSARHVSQNVEAIAAGTKEGIRILLEALVSSGVAMCIAGSTRPASGSEHLFAHAVTILCKNPPLHGELVGVGTIMMSYLHGKNWKKIRKLLKTVGAPVTAKELGVPDSVIIDALEMAAKIRPERYTILGEEGLTREAAEALARATGVID
jgi:glycerol-1-phosphate dehydrogenase [NAD(P)+]